MINFRKKDVSTEYVEPGTEFDPMPRRDFLAMTGFSAAAVSLMTGCMRPPEQSVVPYLKQSPEMQPGQAVWYTTVCKACPAGCGALVKVRDGRPIKLEGNPEHPLSRGGLCAVGQASLLGLYDEYRFTKPQLAGEPVSWDTLDDHVTGNLRELAGRGGTIRILSGTVNSPLDRAAINTFLANFSDGRHIEYDPVSVSAVASAYEQTHGRRLLPHYRFDRAKVIVSFGADFLGTWISPVEFTGQYSTRRDPDKPDEFSWHCQFETILSPTGARADERRALTPSRQRAALLYLANILGDRTLPAVELPVELLKEMDRIAGRLLHHQGESIVVCGLQNLDAQQAVNSINHHLGNENRTVLLSSASRQRMGDDRALAELIREMEAGKVDALFIADANPVYDLPTGEHFAELLTKIPLTVALAERADETTIHSDVLAALSHPLESWSDCSPVEGVQSIQQPCIRPLADTRSMAVSFARWSGTSESDHDLLRKNWRNTVYPQANSEESFDAFWVHSLKSGFVLTDPGRRTALAWRGAKMTADTAVSDGMELVLYSKTALPEGRHACNPMLQEMPDPISKITWDNYACMSKKDADRFRVAEGDQVRVQAGTSGIVLPAHIQPGQAENTIAIALGYGRDISARFRDVGPRWLEDDVSTGSNGLVGVNAAPLLELREHLFAPSPNVELTRTGSRIRFAKTQEYDLLDVPARLTPPDGGHRDLLVEGSLERYTSSPSHFMPHPHMEGDNLWPADHTYEGHHWGLALDLARCTGCSACVVSCQLENNVPVVGKDEVRRNRELHWLRVDRYYRETQHGEMSASFQPVMCQQCEHAPCETVCPVLATVHSDEGLNQQIYNRCVGTRYCANNCPYKMRRFNWFNYPRGTEKERLALNPDVTVRSRGVMEKCTFCVQRIQERKQRAKREGRPLRDGEIKPACQQSCPAGAFVFGDLNDPNSEISRIIASGRAYKMLEELNVRPAVHYLASVRNNTESLKEAHHG